MLNATDTQATTAAASDPTTELVVFHVDRAHETAVLASLDPDVRRERAVRAHAAARQARFDASPVWKRG